jgi:GNAT superfamily N-acetyltransferase
VQPFVVRDARPDDCVAITELAFASKAHWGYDDAFMTACREELTVRPADLERGHIRVAERDGALIGFHGVMLTPEPELEWLFVAPGAIRTGVGRVLLADARRIADAAGAHQLRIAADPNAEAFYAAHGARRVGEVPSESIPGRVVPLLELDISSNA